MIYAGVVAVYAFLSMLVSTAVAGYQNFDLESLQASTSAYINSLIPDFSIESIVRAYIGPSPIEPFLEGVATVPINDILLMASPELEPYIMVAAAAVSIYNNAEDIVAAYEQVSEEISIRIAAVHDTLQPVVSVCTKVATSASALGSEVTRLRRAANASP